MKINNKGFMMAEVIVVSAVVLVVLSTLYISYNKLYQIYSSRLDYYDTVTLYRLSYYRDILIENKVIDKTMTEVKNSDDKVMDIYDSTNGMNSIFSLPETEISNHTEDRVLIIYNQKQNLSANILDNQENINQTFKDYMQFLSTSADMTKTNYVMIMERCNTENNNDCKYAYLELYDGTE